LNRLAAEQAFDVSRANAAIIDLSSLLERGLIRRAAAGVAGIAIDGEWRVVC